MTATSTNSARTRIVRQYWRRTDAPAPWWPRGLLPLLGLMLLFLFGLIGTAPAIQQETLDSVKQQLSDNGINVDSIEADGRRIQIQAQTAGLNETQIRAIVKGTECDTWVGDQVCPTAVNIELSDGADKVAPTTPQMAGTTARRFHNFEFTREDAVITLRGDVPTVEARNRLAKDATAAFASVRDELTVTGEQATHRYRQEATRALEVLTRMNSGSISWIAGKLSVKGQLRPEQEPVVRGLLAETDVAKLSLQAMRSPEECNQRFADLLQQSEIRFRSGSAIIDSSSTGLLGKLAALADECPGNLKIAGHTDSVGDAGMNQALSQSRAAAVREALTELGVVAQRLNARGYGETQPVANNGTPEGRAQNRRITIQLDDEI